MKLSLKTFCIAAAIGIVAALPALAGLPTYRTVTGINGTSTQPATALLPADPNAQIRIVTINYSDDNAGGQFTFTTGGTAYSCVLTNPASYTTNAITSTNNLYGNETLLLQHGGVCYTNIVSSFGVMTNANGSGITNQNYYVILAAGFPVGESIGDNIWQMTNGVNVVAGATTNWLDGDDIYSGNYGCPVEVQIAPTTTISRLNNVSAHYDSQSQP